MTLREKFFQWCSDNNVEQYDDGTYILSYEQMIDPTNPIPASLGDKVWWQKGADDSYHTDPTGYVLNEDVILSEENGKAYKDENGDYKKKDIEYSRINIFDTAILTGKKKALKSYWDSPNLFAGHHSMFSATKIDWFKEYNLDVCRYAAVKRVKGMMYKGIKKSDHLKDLLGDNARPDDSDWEKFKRLDYCAQTFINDGFVWNTPEFIKEMKWCMESISITSKQGLLPWYQWLVASKQKKSTEIPWPKGFTKGSLDKAGKVPLTRDDDDLIRVMKRRGNFSINTYYTQMYDDAKAGYDLKRDMLNGSYQYRQDYLFGDNPKVSREKLMPFICALSDGINDLTHFNVPYTHKDGSITNTEMMTRPTALASMTSDMTEYFFKECITDLYGTEWKENSNDRMDCVSLDAKWSHEKKVSQQKKVHWSTGAIKNGWVTVTALNPDNPQEIIMAIVWVKPEYYKGGKGVSKLHLAEVAKTMDGSFKEITGVMICGDIAEVKKKNGESHNPKRYQPVYEDISKLDNPNKVKKLTAEDRRPGKVTASQHSFY